MSSLLLEEKTNKTIADRKKKANEKGSVKLS